MRELLVKNNLAKKTEVAIIFKNKKVFFLNIIGILDLRRERKILFYSDLCAYLVS